MYRLTNPFIWLYRIRHRCGYGVHSPFAFCFITEVIYETTSFYAYMELDKSLSYKDRFRVRKVLHLLMRISNWRQPDVIACLSSSVHVAHYLAAGCRKARIIDHFPDETIDLCWIEEPNDEVLTHFDEQSVLVLNNLNKHKEWFTSLPAIVSFDLYDVGIAFFDNKYNKQLYIINF